MKQSDTQPSAAYRTLSDYYLMALWALLAGYAIVGKPFAYIGVPPVYVGEIVFALGIVAFLNSKCAVAAFATLPSLLLGVLVGWTILRTLPYLGEFGVDALRDSVIVVYGGFALIIVALLLERPERILLIIRFLRVVATIAIVVAPCLLVLRLMGIIELPVKAGLVADHLAGAGLLILLGFMRASVGWRIILLIGIALIATQSRGAMFGRHHSHCICNDCYRQIAQACCYCCHHRRADWSRLHGGFIDPHPQRDRTPNQCDTACSRILQVFSRARTPVILPRQPIGANFGGKRSSNIHLRGPTFGPARALGSILQQPTASWLGIRTKRRCGVLAQRASYYTCSSWCSRVGPMAP